MDNIPILNKIDLSHNVYSEDSKNKSRYIPTYLVYTGKNIYYAESITEAINIAKSEKCICTLFKVNNSYGKFWNSYVDISVNIFTENNALHSLES